MRQYIKREDFVSKYGSYLEIRTRKEGVDDIFLDKGHGDVPFYIGEVPAILPKIENEFDLSRTHIAKEVCINLNTEYINKKILYLEGILRDVNKIIKMFSSQVKKEYNIIENNIKELKELLDQPEKLSNVEYLPDHLVLLKLNDGISKAIIIDHNSNRVYRTEMRVEDISNSGSAINKYYFEDSLEKIPYAVKRSIVNPHEFVFKYGLMIKDRDGKSSFYYDFPCYQNLMPDIEKGRLPINMSGFEFFWDENVCNKEMKKKIDVFQKFINS